MAIESSTASLPKQANIPAIALFLARGLLYVQDLRDYVAHPWSHTLRS